jgi:hypothetical protein
MFEVWATYICVGKKRNKSLSNLVESFSIMTHYKFEGNITSFAFSLLIFYKMSGLQ